MKLIRVSEVANIINRHKSAVYTYMNATPALLPQPVKKSESCRSQFWCEKSVMEFMPLIIEYQKKKSKRRDLSKRSKKKSKVDRSYRPPLSAAEIAVNKAFRAKV